MRASFPAAAAFIGFAAAAVLLLVPRASRPGLLLLTGGGVRVSGFFSCLAGNKPRKSAISGTGNADLKMKRRQEKKPLEKSFSGAF